MPSYVFHVRDGIESLDGATFECASIEALRAEALRAAGELLREERSDFWRHPHLTMWVNDEKGATVLTMDFFARDLSVKS